MLSGIFGFSQEKTIPEDVRRFIVPGFEMLDYIEGDLNGDKLTDALLLLKQFGEDSLQGEDGIRPFLILIRGENGKLAKVLRNDSVIMCRHCGGVMGDPYSGASIAGNGFSIYFYGGSSWRWAREYQFTYRPGKNTWLLTKESQASFQSGDPEMTMTEIDIEENELEEIAITRFSSAAVYEDSRWKVRAAKTYFYKSPKLGSTPGKAYLVRGNIAKGIRHFKNFIEVSFENAKGVITTGFVLRKDLTVVK